MNSKIIIWMFDQPNRSLVVTELNDAGYNTSLVDNQIITNADENLENCGLLILGIEVLRQTPNIAHFLHKLRRLNECKVLLMSQPEFYPIIRKNELDTNQLTDHILFFPLDKHELLENVKRYLRT